MKKYGFIYITTNTLDGKKYIGQRKYHHNKPNIDRNYFGSGNTIRKLIRKHGKSIFTREIIEECYTPEELNAVERKWIKYYNAVSSPDFYNIHEGGDAGDTWSGQSEEYKEKFKQTIRESNKRRKRDVTKIIGDKNPAFGRHWYKDMENMVQYYLFETDPLITELNLVRGMFRTKEHNEKISKSNKNKPKNYKVYACGCRWMHIPGTKDVVFVKESEFEEYKNKGYVFGIKDDVKRNHK